MRYSKNTFYLVTAYFLTLLLSLSVSASNPPTFDKNFSSKSYRASKTTLKITPDHSRRHYSELYGYVMVHYTVGKDGRSRDIYVAESSLDRAYERQTIQAVQNYEATPAIFNNNRVEDVNKQQLWRFGQNIGSYDLQRKIKKIVSSLKKASSAGHPVAMYEYAMLLSMEDGNQGISQQLIRVAANKGLAQAQFIHGMKQFVSYKKYDVGIHYINLAAQQGYAKAQLQLAKIIHQGIFIKPDVKSVIALLEQASINEPVAKKLLAEILLDNADPQPALNLDNIEELLDDAEDDMDDDPEIIYALAQLEKSSGNHKKYSNLLEEAADEAKKRKWDICQWENELNNIEYELSCNQKENITAINGANKDLFLYNDHYYQFVLEPISWEKASEKALNAGGSLANLAFPDLISLALNKRPQKGPYWVNLTDIADEGIWAWGNGQHVPITEIGLLEKGKQRGIRDYGFINGGGKLSSRAVSGKRTKGWSGHKQVLGYIVEWPVKQ